MKLNFFLKNEDYDRNDAENNNPYFVLKDVEFPVIPRVGEFINIEKETKDGHRVCVLYGEVETVEYTQILSNNNSTHKYKTKIDIIIEDTGVIMDPTAFERE